MRTYSRRREERPRIPLSIDERCAQIETLTSAIQSANNSLWRGISQNTPRATNLVEPTISTQESYQGGSNEDLQHLSKTGLEIINNKPGKEICDKESCRFQYGDLFEWTCIQCKEVKNHAR